MSCVRGALEQSERAFDGVDERPVEIEQLAPCPPRQDDAGHRLAGVAAVGQLSAKVLEPHGLVS